MVLNHMGGIQRFFKSPGKVGLSFFVVLYSTFSLYAVIKMVLLDERGCHA